MKLQNDYSFVRGVCHGPGFGTDVAKMREIWRRDFGYMKRLNLNSIRFWMSEEAWKKDNEGYCKMLKSYAKEAAEADITLMPIFFNGNALDTFTPLTAAEWSLAEAYSRAVINTLKDEPNIIMWDAINEPFCCEYLHNAPENEKEERWNNIRDWTRKCCQMIAGIDRTIPLTVGHELAPHVETSADLVDVISYHDYLHTRAEMEGALKMTIDFAKGKPVMNTETGCACRANPYDAELELCARYHIGFYIFNLIIEGPWADVHGLVYPDGTVRDPSIAAAVMGFFRKRSDDRILYNPNREHHAEIAISRLQEALSIKVNHMHRFSAAGVDEILDAAEYGADILEAAEMVAMRNPPSAKILHWRNLGSEQKNAPDTVEDIKAFAYGIIKQLREGCLL
ncbi:MAG: hypothetical protein LBM77_07925 [Spirochaetaceae bacterium]|jgi:hypothetical protein|nr:hypothetical protein [Spirochaetaceae bacterium]